jgi:hypothetical protein
MNPPVKPFCPCDAGRPQDCKPEEWGDAHGKWTDCDLCRWKVPHQDHNR